MCTFLLSALGPHLLQTHESPVRMAIVSVSSYVHWFYLFRRPFSPGVLHSFDSFYLLFCSECPLTLEEGDLMETPHLWLSALISLILCKLSNCGSLSVLICFRRKLFWLWLNKVLMWFMDYFKYSLMTYWFNLFLHFFTNLRIH